MTSDSLTPLEGGESSSPLEAEAVAQYLAENPNFFIGKEDLIRDLTFPHESGGAISIVERQVLLLRERNTSLQTSMHDFINNAKENDALFEKVRLIILELLHSFSLEALSTVIATKLNADFTATASKLLFIGDQHNDMLSLAANKKVLGELFDKKRTFCGPIAKRQASLFFPDEDPEIISAAIIPVHLADKTLADKLGMPVLVIGSDKAEHFNSSLDTLFLDFIGEVLAAHIAHICQAQTEL